MGEIRKLPAVEPRVETGPVQFGDDWPGTFIRGDNAFTYARHLRIIIEALQPDRLDHMMLYSLLSDLESSELKHERTN